MASIVKKNFNSKRRVLVLAKNFFNNSGYYHTDWLEAFQTNFDCFFYGPGFPHYSSEHKISDVLKKASNGGEIEAVICSTNWDEDGHHFEVNPCPNIDLSQINGIPKIYFLNKEYKKLKQRFDYCNRMGFTCAVTVNEKYRQWQSELNAKIIKLHFAVNPNRFKALETPQIWDFAFTGGLHQSHLDSRFSIKTEIFQEKYVRRKTSHSLLGHSRLKPQYNTFKINWMEFGAKNWFYRSRLPSENKYNLLLNQCRSFLNTRSAAGIINTRFYELMQTRTLIICPRDKTDYDGLLKNGVNCISYEDPKTELFDILEMIKQENTLISDIVQHNYSLVQKHTYENRVRELISEIW